MNKLEKQSEFHGNDEAELVAHLNECRVRSETVDEKNLITPTDEAEMIAYLNECRIRSETVGDKNLPTPTEDTSSSDENRFFNINATSTWRRAKEGPREPGHVDSKAQSGDYKSEVFKQDSLGAEVRWPLTRWFGNDDSLDLPKDVIIESILCVYDESREYREGLDFELITPLEWERWKVTDNNPKMAKADREWVGADYPPDDHKIFSSANVDKKIKPHFPNRYRISWNNLKGASRPTADTSYFVIFMPSYPKDILPFYEGKEPIMVNVKDVRGVQKKHPFEVVIPINAKTQKHDFLFNPVLSLRPRNISRKRIDGLPNFLTIEELQGSDFKWVIPVYKNVNKETVKKSWASIDHVRKLRIGRCHIDVLGEKLEQLQREGRTKNYIDSFFQNHVYCGLCVDWLKNKEWYLNLKHPRQIPELFPNGRPLRQFAILPKYLEPHYRLKSCRKHKDESLIGFCL